MNNTAASMRLGGKSFDLVAAGEGKVDPRCQSLPFLQWLPGETLFSLVSRHHGLWGYRFAEETAYAAFGHPRLGWRHDLPSGLDGLVRIAGDKYGDAGTIGLDRTLLRYYRPFLNESSEQDCVVAMGGASLARLKYRLGLLNPRVSDHHPLKACLDCIEEDRGRTGWSWWHMEHQYPGVGICPRHGVGLWESTARITSRAQSRWILPDVRDLKCVLPHDAMGDADALAPIARFARLVGNVVDRRPIVRLDSNFLRMQYRNELVERGFVCRRGHIALAAAAEAFLTHVRPLQLVVDSRVFPENIDQAKRLLLSVLRRAQTPKHPLCELVMIDWLIGDFFALARRFAASIEAAST